MGLLGVLQVVRVIRHSVLVLAGVDLLETSQIRGLVLVTDLIEFSAQLFLKFWG